MLTILVINSKGGSGKTTVATTLASYYASKKYRTAIMDYDPQGSSLHWLETRSAEHEVIHGVNAAPAKGAVTLRHKSWLPSDTEVLIIDAPAGTTGVLLKDLVRKADHILIPVMPSPIDIHATADFIKDLYLIGGALTTKVKIAVVANRVRNRNSAVYAALEKFLASLRLPFLTSISDSEIYLQAVGQGVGVFEMDEMLSNTERHEIAPILKWLESAFPNRYGAHTVDNIINLVTSKQYAAHAGMGKN